LLLVTCEHGGDRVPGRYAARLAAGRRLPVHRWYDIGALELAGRFAAAFGAPLVQSTVTRLLVDLNRSLGHRRLFSEFTASWDERTKQAIVDRYWLPYRRKVETLIETLAAEALAAARPVVHLSVHSFTPVLDGRARRADVGLLYDPASTPERRLAAAWQAALRRSRPDLVVRRNYPYRGTADGLTTSLRGRFGRTGYAGIELEVSQRWPRGNPAAWQRLQRDLIESSLSACPQ
jgi:predicted N-formylglutamate amidohydrolase